MSVGDLLTNKTPVKDLDKNQSKKEMNPQAPPGVSHLQYPRRPKQMNASVVASTK